MPGHPASEQAERTLPSMNEKQDPSEISEDNAEIQALIRNLSAVIGRAQFLTHDDGNPLADRLRDHLGADPKGLPVLSQELPPYQLVDVQVALDVWTGVSTDREMEVFGLSGDQRRFHPLSELLAGGGMYGISIGTVDYVDLADSPDSTRKCVRFGVFLLRDGARRCAALIRGPDPHGPMQEAMIDG